MSAPARTAGRRSSHPWTVRNLFVPAAGFTTGIAAVIVASSCRSNPEAAGARSVPSVASTNIGGGSADHARTDPHAGNPMVLRVTITQITKDILKPTNREHLNWDVGATNNHRDVLSRTVYFHCYQPVELLFFTVRYIF